MADRLSGQYNPHYLNLQEARQVLEEVGISINERQIKRAAEPDAHGKRKLPFFKDPIDGRLKINRDTLLGLYQSRQKAAENSMTLDR